MPENPKSPRDRFVDDVLDASLRNYGRTGARDGLENRVLRRLQEAPKTSWFAGVHWSAIGALATVLVVVLALFTYPPDRVAPSPKAQPAPAQVQPVTPIPQVVAPPPDRTPRYNKTMQQSGVRPKFGGVRPAGELPPCKPGEEPAGAIKKRDKATAGAVDGDRSKVSPDCVPASPKRQQSPPIPPH
jgi:hypothetical protein